MKDVSIHIFPSLKLLSLSLHFPSLSPLFMCVSSVWSSLFPFLLVVSSFSHDSKTTIPTRLVVAVQSNLFSLSMIARMMWDDVYGEEEEEAEFVLFSPSLTFLSLSFPCKFFIHLFPPSELSPFFPTCFYPIDLLLFHRPSFSLPWKKVACFRHIARREYESSLKDNSNVNCLQGMCVCGICEWDDSFGRERDCLWKWITLSKKQLPAWRTRSEEKTRAVGLTFL